MCSRFGSAEVGCVLCGPAADAEVPLVRLAGFLSYLARVLNVDGYACSTSMRGPGSATVDTAFLGQQFEITVS